MSANTLQPVLLAVPVVMMACQAGGWAVRRIGQPPVIGEIAAGILLGPTLLGWLAPSVHQHLLPPSALPVISAMGNLALLSFLFLMGMELDLRSLRRSKYAVVGVSLSGILLPAALGTVLGLVMYPDLAPAGVARLQFVLFIAVALSITAFPVLARILSDRGMETSQLGTFVMACAAVDDAVAWCLLIVVVALSTAGAPLSAVSAVLLAGTLTGALFTLRPALRKLLDYAGRTSDDIVLVVLCAGAFLTGFATEVIGVHAAFGAFIFGACIPRGDSAVERSAARLRAVFIPVLLPLFFVSIGLQTDLSDLPLALWGWGLVILAAAIAGKWGGATTAARLTSSNWRWAAAVGTLMNCRGLTELVVLGIGLQIGVITSQLYAALVVMAVVTTALTSPLLSRLTRGHPHLSPRPEPVGVAAAALAVKAAQ